MKNKGFLKVRVYPSLDFTLGSSDVPKKDTTPCSTEITEDSYRVGYKSLPFYEISTNERLNQQAMNQSVPENMTPDQAVKLLNAYESAYLKQVESGDTAAAAATIDKIERLASCPSLMGLSVAINSHKPVRRQRGLTGITPYGKRMVRSGAAILERNHGRECLTLGTCTLPPLSPDEWERVCLGWSDIVRKFFQELSRELIRRGLSDDYVQVTEMQERRFSQSGDVGLHLHWLIQGRKTRSHDWAFTPAEVRDIWRRILSNAIGRDPDCTAATRIESLRTSCLQEMGKYLSKGGTAIKAVVAAGKSHLLPPSWWGSAKGLKSQVQSSIIQISGLAAVWLDSRLKEMKRDGQIWYVDIWIENDGREFRAGAVGRFCSQAACDEILEARDVLETVEWGL